jgi:carboxyl-terminal processing protease
LPFLAQVLTVFAAVSLAVGRGMAADSLTPEQRRINLDSFEYVWKTVRDKHWDPKLGGIDWQSVHDELKPRVESAQTMEEARRVVSSMLDRLHQTHFGLIPADAYSAIGDTGEAGETEGGQTGIEIRILAGHAIVSSIAPDSPARDAGVLTGWEIVRIGKTDTASVISKLSEVSPQSHTAELMIARALRSRLDGKIGSEVTIEFSDLNGKQISKRVTRRAESGELARFGFLPPMVVNFESRKLSGNVEYIRFNLFLKPDVVVTRFGQAIHDCGHCPGVIIDLRGNPGGIGAMAMGMAGFLISQPDQKLGTMYMRSLPIRFVIFPRPEVYDGPVAILVDGLSASTAEIFAGGLQDLKRARIFGEHTAGAALPSVIERLPNGDGFQYAMANYISDSGRQLEGNGVTPDVEVLPDRKALSAGHDPVVDAALNWFRTESREHAGSRASGGRVVVAPKVSDTSNGGGNGPVNFQFPRATARFGR